MVYFPCDSLKANASLNPIKSFCKKGKIVFKFSSSELLLLFSKVSSGIGFVVKLVRIINPIVSPKFLIIKYFLLSGANVYFILLMGKIVN